MPKEEKLILRAKVVEALPMGLFKVKVTDNSADFGDILCHLGGKLRTSNIRVLVGDEVDIEISPYDLKKGRITYRHTGSKKIEQKAEEVIGEDEGVEEMVEGEILDADTEISA